MATPPPPPPPPGTAGFGLASALSPGGSTSSTTSTPLLTPSAIASATAGTAIVATSGPTDSNSTLPAPLSSPLTGVFINQHVPHVLQLNPPNYTQWRTLFEVTFTKLGVDDHILNPPAAATYWLQDDAYIISWLYNRVSPEIFGLVHQRRTTAAQLWSSIATQFMENREHQAVFLATEFCRIEQGSGSVISYFACLKDCADRLADLGKPVTDRDQVLNMFRGLNPRLHSALPILTMQSPFPTFLRCHAFLLLEESRMNAYSDTSSDTALVARVSQNNGGGSGGAPAGAPTTSTLAAALAVETGTTAAVAKARLPPPAPPAPAAETPRLRVPPPRRPLPRPGQAWCTPGPCPHMPGAGILGARLGAPPPFAGMASHYGAPPPYYFPAAPSVPAHGFDAGSSSSSAPPPAWDLGALIQALNNMSV
ncbi:hypothetical protein ACQ4PT_049856 [Festuca glaucescens]